MAENFTFFYFGDDEAYFRALQGEFRKSTRMAISFQRFYEVDERKIQSFFLKIYEQKAACVFIDFSRQSQDYLHLARILARTPLEHPLVTVGLVDYLSPPEVLVESIATGVNLTHIKSVETYDVIYDVTRLLSPADIEAPPFATATLSEEWEAGLTCKIGYVHSLGLHLETNQRLAVGDRIRLSHHWSKAHVVPSQEVFVTSVSTSNLFYNFKYAVDVEFVFEDEFLPPEGMEEDRIQEKLADREHAIKQSKKKLRAWLEDRREPSHEKKAKIMIVDKTFRFYDHQGRSDKYAYTIRCVPSGVKVLEEYERLRPQVIVYAMEKVAAGEAPSKDSNDELLSLVNRIKDGDPEARPFLIVFNNELGSKDMQLGLGYSQVLTSPGEVDPQTVLKLAEAFSKKINGEGASDEDRVYINKTNSMSVCEILVPVRALKLTESNMIFQCETELAEGSNLHLTTPVEMYVNVQASKPSGKVPEYLGLIHCLGETPKKDLRRYVNSIFFREHDAKLLQEAEEYKKLNEAKRIEKEAPKVEEVAAEGGEPESEQ